jgi:acyl-CoA thioesterase I
MQRRALLLLPLLGACGKKPSAAVQRLPAGATVLCLGDSITQGVGAAPAAAYPAVLALLTGLNVINGGVSGDVSAQALERLPALLAEHRPQLVIVSIGGNDFLRRIPAEETQAHIRRIVALVREAQAQVLLVAVPQPSLGAAVGAAVGVGLSDHPMYAQLAAELKAPLHEDGWAEVLGDDTLKSDQIHANAEGYRRFAQGLAATLRSVQLI